MTFRISAAPPQRQTVYYAHTGRAVVAKDELFMEVGDHTFLQPLLPLYEAVRALAPPGDPGPSLARVDNKVRSITVSRNTDLRRLVHSIQRSGNAPVCYVMVRGMEELMEIITWDNHMM